MNARVIACKILINVIQSKQSLNVVFANTLPKNKDAGLIQELCYGVLRWYQKLDFISQQLLQKPLKSKDFDIQLLLLLGFYQICGMRIPNHAAVFETANAAKVLKKTWAIKLINGVLREFIRKQQQVLQLIEKNQLAYYSHPQWLVDKLKVTWPKHWQTILINNNQAPPFCLRINLQKISREHYLQMLQQQDMLAKEHPIVASAVLLEKAISVIQLPGFEAGLVSVQDAAAQLAAYLLQVNPNERVLDCCAAPGGKTAHLLEQYPALAELIALDIDVERCQRIYENLQRLSLHAKVITADANTIESWWDNQPFDKILLDAPCSATGVIRRHPDIKFLRRPNDFTTLAKQQLNLLKNIWKLLAKDGVLLYATCSIMPDENERVIETFVESCANVTIEKINVSFGMPQKYGLQIFPGEYDMDGFYYCLLRKR